MSDFFSNVTYDLEEVVESVTVATGRKLDGTNYTFFVIRSKKENGNSISNSLTMFENQIKTVHQRERVQNDIHKREELFYMFKRFLLKIWQTKRCLRKSLISIRSRKIWILDITGNQRRLEDPILSPIRTLLHIQSSELD